MNKIFKVIWSKSRNCYVVASELAKGHTKASSTGDKTRRPALAAITALILLPVGGFSYAADATIMVEPVGTGSTTAVEVYTKEGIDKGQESLQKDIQKFSKEVQNELLSIGENIQATDGAYVDAFKSVGENLNALDTQVKANADAINEEALKRKYSVTNLEKADAAEAAAREAADTALDTRITNVKEYLEKQTSDNYVSKDDAAVQDGAIVRAANTIGENVALLDKGLADETAARLGADAAQDKVIQQVNQNMVDGFNALSQADANELAGRVAADTKLVGAVNSGLSLSDDNVLQKNTTTIDAQGNVTTSKTDAHEMILNKGKDNQITLNEKGIKVGTNSTVVDKDGVYTGGDTYSEAKAAMSADGSIKGANGAFTVDENGNVTSKATITGETVTDGKGASMSNGTVTGKTLTDGIATIANGNINTSGSITGGTVTSTGNISALGDIHAGGAITGASASIQGALTAGSATITGDLTAGGAIQGKSISDSTATMQNGNLTGVKNLSTETITTSGDATIGGDLTVNGKLNVDEIDLTKNGIVGDNNVTASTKVAAGEITSYQKTTSTKDGSEKESAIDYDENGTSTWAKSTDADGNWKKSTLTVEGSDVTSKVVDSDKNSNESKQTSTESSDVVKDADGNTSTFSQRVKDILQEIKNASGDTLTKVEQTDTAITSQIGDGSAVKSEMTADGITNTAVGGTITNSAKDLVNTATGNMTNTVGGELKTTVTGKVTEDYKSDLDTKVGGNQTTTVTGDSSLTAENITNEAKNKITNKAIDVETDASSSIVSKVSNEYGSNTSTQLCYQTKEEMSQVDGKTASYLRGAAEEKSQLTDGDKKTTIDTIAGQTNTNITDGTNTSNSLQKADQVAFSVTDGTNTTVVNQDAMSLASSITDGTKANNTNITVDKSEQLIKASDTQYSATTKTEDALVNGSTLIDIVKDSTTGMVSSAVTDGNTSTGISQSAKDISLSAAGGTIANAAQNITNTASESITNTVGKTTVTTTDSGTTFENTDHNTAIKEGTVTKTTISGNTIETGQATMDYADVMKDLGVHGNATVDQKLTVKGDSDLQGNANVGKNLTVNGTSDLKGDVTMESNATVEKDLTVEGTTKTEKLVVNNGATVTGGTTTDTLHVTSTSTFDGQATFKDIVTMEKDLSVGGYKGETATAIGAFYRPNENVMVNVSSSFGTGENMYGGGISLRIGQGGNKARRNATNGLTEREKAQQKQIDYLTSRLDALLSVINPNMSKDFPDVPENHWAYEAVSKLAGNGIIQGYEDGKYHGERTMTRYEMAEIIYNALSKGAKAEKKLVEEFKPEIQAMAAQKKA